MALMPGYEDSEIGPIPKDWDAVPMAELFTFKNGLNKAKKFFGHGTPIVNYMDVFRHSGLRLQQVQGRVDVSKAELQSFEVRKGDVFFTRTSETVEEIGRASAMLDEPSMTVFSGFVLRARPKAHDLDDRFKAYCFSPRYFREQVIARATYTTRALTNGRALSAAKLAVPPLPEQRAIAEALADVNAVIEAMTNLIDKKRDLRTAAMQRLLSRNSRLAGGDRPWEMRTIHSLGDMKSGQGITSARIDTSSAYPCYGGNGLRGFTSTFTHEGDFVLIGRVGALCGNVLQVSGRFYASEHAIVVTPAEDVEARFLSIILKRLKLGRLSESSAQPVLSVSKLAKLEVLWPPTKAEQAAIAEVLSNMDAEVDGLAARLAKAEALEQAMRQALLTGRVRFPAADVQRADKEPVHA